MSSLCLVATKLARTTFKETSPAGICIFASGVSGLAKCLEVNLGDQPLEIREILQDHFIGEGQNIGKTPKKEVSRNSINTF